MDEYARAYAKFEAMKKLDPSIGLEYDAFVREGKGGIPQFVAMKEAELDAQIRAQKEREEASEVQKAIEESASSEKTNLEKLRLELKERALAGLEQEENTLFALDEIFKNIDNRECGLIIWILHRDVNEVDWTIERIIGPPVGPKISMTVEEIIRWLKWGKKFKIKGKK